MPRPINYLNKLKKWARKTDGCEGIRHSLIYTINQYLLGKAKLEEVNKLVKLYSASIKEPESAGILDNMYLLENYLSNDEMEH
jgi:hypothetical protein